MHQGTKLPSSHQRQLASKKRTLWPSYQPSFQRFLVSGVFSQKLPAARRRLSRSSLRSTQRSARLPERWKPLVKGKTTHFPAAGCHSEPREGKSFAISPLASFEGTAPARLGFQVSGRAGRQHPEDRIGRSLRLAGPGGRFLLPRTLAHLKKPLQPSQVMALK